MGFSFIRRSALINKSCLVLRYIAVEHALTLTSLPCINSCHLKVLNLRSCFYFNCFSCLGLKLSLVLSCCPVIGWHNCGRLLSSKMGLTPLAGLTEICGIVLKFCLLGEGAFLSHLRMVLTFGIYSHHFLNREYLEFYLSYYFAFLLF
jgi:hypothetical protein